MRGFLIFLAVAFPAVLFMPSFWLLVGMEYGSVPIGLVHHDGVRQEAIHGAQAPWPDWVPTPEGSRLTVKVWYGDASPHRGNGFGDLAVRGDAVRAAMACAERLRLAGFEIATVKLVNALPEIPPRDWVQCVVEAKTQDGRMIVAAFEMAPEPGNGRVFWSLAPRPSLARGGEPTC